MDWIMYFYSCEKFIVQTVGDGSSGLYRYGSGLVGASYLSTYSFFLNAPAYNISRDIS
jgi:hypothetical protein